MTARLTRMQRKLESFIDMFVPADLREFEQSEELVRARSLVFIALLSLVAAIGIFLASMLVPIMPEEIVLVSRWSLVGCALGNVMCLRVFRRSGRFVAAANVYVVTTYLATMVSIISGSTPEYLYLLMVVFCIPAVMAYITNYPSAITWLLVVALSPLPIAATGNPLATGFFVVCWMVGCFTMLTVLCMEWFYRETMRARLHTEINRFEFAAAHDPLTGVANRTTFDRRLRECIESCILHDTRTMLVVIDLDRFKSVNDNHGHLAGDTVLSETAQRLRTLVRRSDTVARLGGDEFAILMEIHDPGEAEAVAWRIVETVAAPVTFQDEALTIGCSTGVAICPDDGVDADELVHVADGRMYAEKRRSQIALVPTSA